MKIGIIGCGLNSDYHINFAKAYRGAEIVGVMDKDPDKARECAERFKIKGVYTDMKTLVEETRPDLLHILTPPKTHFAVASEALELGVNILLEKPMTLNLAEAEALYDKADDKGLKLCTMHNHLYDPCMHAVDLLVKDGSVGRVMNVESYYGLNTRIPAFRDYPRPNQLPWLYDLPGSIYHDFMPHPLYVLLEYTGEVKEIKVMSTSNGVLPQGMADEIRILVKGKKALGTLTFSFAARPHLHFIRVYGTEMMAEVDINTMTYVTHPLSSLPKAAQKATYNLNTAWQLTRSTISNVQRFVRKKLKPYQGMKHLIHLYYDALASGGEPPVSRAQALAVISAMDEIWKQLEIKKLEFEPIVPVEPRFPLMHKEKMLVTGGTGFVGRRLVEALVKEGYPVRVLARKLSNVEPLKALGVEIYYGDVADMPSLTTALEGIDCVVHAAAGTSGDKKDCDTATILGTENIISACRSSHIDKLVYISSCSVYGVAGYKAGQLVNEGSALERFPEKRGEYSASKQRAEGFILDAIKDGLKAVVLRPGTIYGPGGETYTPMHGFSAGSNFIVIGNGKFELPIVHIDNLVDAIILSIQKDGADGQVLNVVDGEKITKRQYMKRLIKILHPKARVFYLPYTILYATVFAQEVLCKIMGRRAFLTRYRLTSSQRSITYDNSRLRKLLGWKPRVGLDEAVDGIVEHEKSGSS